MPNMIKLKENLTGEPRNKLHNFEISLQIQLVNYPKGKKQFPKVLSHLKSDLLGKPEFMDH